MTDDLTFPRQRRCAQSEHGHAWKPGSGRLVCDCGMVLVDQPEHVPPLVSVPR